MMKYKSAEVKFQVSFPKEVTEEQALEWIRFELKNNGSMHGDNPLSDHDLEASNVKITSIRQW